MILYPERFQQAEPAGFDGVFDWDFLLPAFYKTKIQPMDIDAVVERRGKILLFETKEPGKDIPLGQKITLERFILIGKGDICLFLVYGKTEREINCMQEWHYLRGRINKLNKISCDAAYVLKRVTDWFNWANQYNGCRE